jgi:two-component system OmpR family sensor kinase
VTLPGGIRVRLALALVLIVAGALGTAYLIVVPSLERQLVDQRLDRLEVQIRAMAQELPAERFEWRQRVEVFAERTNARVVVFTVLSRNPPTVTVFEDSRRAGRPRDVIDDPIAIRTVVSGSVERGRVIEDPGDWAEVAAPIDRETVMLFRASLADSLATVRLVQRRLLLATGFALVLALLLGLTAAGMLAHRLRRLETAADRIARGDFDVPIVDRGNDEIGQLAGAFDQMRVRLAQLDNARKEFVANASHELRTPLFSIGGFLELLTDEELDEDTRREFLATMQGQVARLTKLSTDLLDLSRVDAGQLVVLEEPVELGSAAGILEQELEHVAAASGHELEVALDGQVWALGDPERVIQIGRALAVNALTHTPPGTSVAIRVRSNGDRAELSVEDEGPGIPLEHQSAVFERFYRVEGGVASGSGLGLSIARELARLMNGTVELESRPGRTVVTLQLPASEPPEAVPQAFSRENEDPALHRSS